MTVGDLIAFLQTMPPEERVVVTWESIVEQITGENIYRGEYAAENPHRHVQAVFIDADNNNYRGDFTTMNRDCCEEPDQFTVEVLGDVSARAIERLQSPIEHPVQATSESRVNHQTPENQLLFRAFRLPDLPFGLKLDISRHLWPDGNHVGLEHFYVEDTVGDDEK